MTRAAEFCYIAERQEDGALLRALLVDGSTLWTQDPEMAIRTTEEGRMKIARAVPFSVGFRKILAG